MVSLPSLAVHVRRIPSGRMSTHHDPSQRADAIFTALDASESEGEPLPGLAGVAAEDPSESVRREADVVGDQPDAGGTVPPAQSQ